jgi:hypothetical protein
MLMNSFVWGYAAYRLRRRWIYVVLILYLLLLAWSRMYAGVHFPQDVVGGLLLGLLGLWLYITYIDRATGLWNGSSVWLRLGLALAAGLIILFFPNYDDTGPAFAGMLIGTALGFELEAKYVHFTVAGSQGQRILRYVLGIVLLVIVYYGLRKLEPAASAWLDIYRLLLYSLTAFVAIFFWPWLAQRIGLFKAAPQPE